MERIKYRIVLDATVGGSQQKIRGFYRGESGAREIEIILIKDSDVLYIDDENSVIVYGEKSDGSTFMQSCEAKDGKLIFTPQSSIFSVVGDVQCQVQVLGSDGNILFSPSFTVEVCDNIRNEEAIESSDEFTVLDVALKEVQELKPLVGTDTKTLLKLSEADGALTYNGVRVDEQALKECETLKVDVDDTKEEVAVLRSEQKTDRETIIRLGGEVQELNEQTVQFDRTLSSLDEDILSNLTDKDGELLYNGNPIGEDSSIHVHRIGDPDDPLSLSYEKKAGDFLYITTGDDPDQIAENPVWKEHPLSGELYLYQAPWEAGQLYICSGYTWNLISEHFWTENLLGSVEVNDVLIFPKQSTNSGIEFVEALPDVDGDKIVFLKKEYQGTGEVSEFTTETEYSLRPIDFELLNISEREKEVKFTDKELLETPDYTYAVMFNFSMVSETVKSVFIQATDGALLPDGSMFWVWAEEDFTHETFGEIERKKWYKFDGSSFTYLDISNVEIKGCFIKDKDINNVNALKIGLLNAFSFGGNEEYAKGLYYTDNGCWKILIKADTTTGDSTKLVTSISSNSTDTEYPSAKCVYDLIGNIETLLQKV